MTRERQPECTFFQAIQLHDALEDRRDALRVQRKTYSLVGVQEVETIRST